VPHKQLLGSLAMMALVLIWPTFIEDDYRMRIVLVGTFNAVIFSMCTAVIASMPRKNFAEWFTQIVFLLTACISATRSFTALFQTGALDPASDVSALQQVYLATFAFSILALSLGFMLMANRRLQIALEHKASHDGLTGLLRREPFFCALTKEISHACRHGHPLSLLMMDLDNFKAINDKHGHDGGDQVIVDFARKAQQILRTRDLIGRYGGEEFIVMLPDTTLAGAHVIAERIRNILSGPHADDLPTYTVSIGIAAIQGQQQDAKVLVSQADQALYAAKRMGKNRVEAIC
jgi:diguanylate cyclase (GGDEF)-like protein